MPDPVAEGADFGEGYGGVADGWEPPPWSSVVSQLEASRSYWVVTTRADGRPHASPVWGLFIDNAVWWSTSPDSVKGRNLARDPHVVIHLESGDNVVILEGTAQRLDGDEEFLQRFIEAYEKKYDFRPTAEFLKGQTYRLQPTVGLSWAEETFEVNKVRWRWPSASKGSS